MPFHGDDRPRAQAKARYLSWWQLGVDKTRRARSGGLSVCAFGYFIDPVENIGITT
jgi:hypothetical protein